MESSSKFLSFIDPNSRQHLYVGPKLDIPLVGERYRVDDQGVRKIGGRRKNNSVARPSTYPVVAAKIGNVVTVSSIVSYSYPHQYFPAVFFGKSATQLLRKKTLGTAENDAV